MSVRETDLPGVLVLEPPRYRDDRGYFMEVWEERRYAAAGLPERFVQDNISVSKEGVLRGLHFQHPHPQGKLVTVLEGEIFDVAVDIRRGAPTFGQWVGETLSQENGRQLYVPEGFAHGFAVRSGRALVHYKCTDFYAPDCEQSLHWNDPELNIAWPVDAPIVSDKDEAAPTLETIDSDALPAYASSSG
jgi:dTDP-4-dehydrorhamnose 3,5-epimerase